VVKLDRALLLPNWNLPFFPFNNPKEWIIATSGTTADYLF